MAFIHAHPLAQLAVNRADGSGQRLQPAGQAGDRVPGFGEQGFFSLDAPFAAAGEYPSWRWARARRRST
jgi:hypothetical protein